MKKQALLFSFLIIVSFILHAHEPQQNTIKNRASIRAGEYFNPTRSGVKSDPIVMPQKRIMFNSSTTIWKWDTILCYKISSDLIPDQRVSRTYNSWGNPLTQLTERRRQDNNIWENYARETFTWDSTGNWLSYLAEQWQNNAWVNFLKQTFVYNSNGNMMDWKREGWQSTYWVKGWHYAWHYNSNGLNDTSTYQAGMDSLWVNSSLWIPTYDQNGYVISSLTYTWANNSWAVSQLTTNTNDSMGNILTELKQNYQNGTWVNNSLSTATYDPAGHGLSSIIQLWQNNAWVNMNIFSFTYDSAGNMLSRFRGNGSGNGWINSNLDLYEYDGGNNLLSITYKFWNSSYWESTDRQQYTYDASGNSLTGRYLKWFNGAWLPENGGLSVFADHQNDSKVNLQDVYRYSADVDSVMVYLEPTRSSGLISLFPNPAHTRVYVSWPGASADPNSSLTMYDLRGQLVLSKQMVNETTGIDISGLKQGVYFVRFSDNRMTRVIKLVKD